MSLTIIKPPNALPVHRIGGLIPKSMFLAGSIEQGAAIDWQAKVTSYVEHDVGKSCEQYYIFNPRRDVWDANLEQSINNSKFYEQVSWELTALDCARKILMYFDPATKSPISLLELGLYATSKKLIVCCPEGFWRKGNVEIVCQRYNIPFYTSLDRATFHIADKL